jgi:hypothetical protein
MRPWARRPLLRDWGRRYADAVLKLDAKEVKLQGFMMPLTVGEKQTHTEEVRHELRLQLLPQKGSLHDRGPRANELPRMGTFHSNDNLHMFH